MCATDSVYFVIKVVKGQIRKDKGPLQNDFEAEASSNRLFPYQSLVIWNINFMWSTYGNGVG